jgi:hypothetical protein
VPVTTSRDSAPSQFGAIRQPSVSSRFRTAKSSPSAAAKARTFADIDRSAAYPIAAATSRMAVKQPKTHAATAGPEPVSAGPSFAYATAATNSARNGPATCSARTGEPVRHSGA